ncbi:hypothetical protein Ocin01_19645 [Orchesella cincta]|uniref:Uncharacterized protein n=1 Tax=Orchesella cincta TaxID=48709 RepID=A0A1D2M247_ORCCI|nr:hypothetical protein Ocin01_19645 [Orchesella cincta]
MMIRARARRAQCHQLRILHNIRLSLCFWIFGGTGLGSGGVYQSSGRKSEQQLSQAGRYQSTGGIGGVGARSEGQITGRGLGSGYGSQSEGGVNFSEGDEALNRQGGSFQNNRSSAVAEELARRNGSITDIQRSRRNWHAMAPSEIDIRSSSSGAELARRSGSFGNRRSSTVEELAGRNVSFGNRSSGDPGSAPGGGRNSGRGSSGPTSLHHAHLRDVISEESRPAMLPVGHPIELDESSTNFQEEMGWLKNLLLLYCVLGLTYLLYYLFFTDPKDGSRAAGAAGCGCGPVEEVYDFVP